MVCVAACFGACMNSSAENLHYNASSTHAPRCCIDYSPVGSLSVSVSTNRCNLDFSPHFSNISTMLYPIQFKHFAHGYEVYNLESPINLTYLWTDTVGGS